MSRLARSRRGLCCAPTLRDWAAAIRKGACPRSPPARHEPAAGPSMPLPRREDSRGHGTSGAPCRGARRTAAAERRSQEAPPPTTRSRRRSIRPEERRAADYVRGQDIRLTAGARRNLTSTSYSIVSPPRTRRWLGVPLRCCRRVHRALAHVAHADGDRPTRGHFSDGYRHRAPAPERAGGASLGQLRPFDSTRTSTRGSDRRPEATSRRTRSKAADGLMDRWQTSASGNTGKGATGATPNVKASERRSRRPGSTVGPGSRRRLLRRLLGPYA